jgi:hypothetical protein
VRSARLLTPLDLYKGIFLFLSVCASIGYRALSLRSLGHVVVFLLCFTGNPRDLRVNCVFNRQRYYFSLKKLKPKKPDYLGELEWNLFLVPVNIHPHRYVFCF